jgi:hypothetical protein
VAINESQQQWLTRNSKVDSRTNGVWNQVFSGVAGACGQCFLAANHYTTLATRPGDSLGLYAYEDAANHFSAFLPSVHHNSAATTSGRPPHRCRLRGGWGGGIPPFNLLI